MAKATTPTKGSHDRIPKPVMPSPETKSPVKTSEDKQTEKNR